MTSRIAAALLAAGLAQGLGAADKPSAQQLLDAAHKASDISASIPYVLTGTLVVNAGSGREQAGTIALYRDRDRMRVDIQISGRTETRIGIGEKDHVDPGRVMIAGAWPSELDRLWDPQRPVKGFSSREKWGKVSGRKVGRAEAWCLERGKDHDKEQLCVDAARNLVLTSPHHEFSDFVPLGAVLYPRKIRITDPALAPIEVRDIKISPYPAEAALFEVSERDIELENCENEQPPRVVDSPVPARSGLSAHPTRAEVSLYVFVDKEGRIAASRLMSFVQPGYDSGILQAISKWRFKPATCDGRPVNSAYILRVDGALF